MSDPQHGIQKVTHLLKPPKNRLEKNTERKSQPSLTAAAAMKGRLIQELGLQEQ